MFTNKLILFAFIVNFPLLLFLQQVETASLYTSNNNNNDLYKPPIVYRRYIRRRPPMHPHDEYSDEIVEIFHTKQKPPAFGIRMSDEDIDKFIFCDFNRHLEECKTYWESRKPMRPTTIASKGDTITSTTMKPIHVKPIIQTTVTEIPLAEHTTEMSKIPMLEEYDTEDIENFYEEVEEEKQEEEKENEEEYYD